MLLIVSGASGVGKSTLCRRLLATHPQLTLSVSYTTRAPRGAEQNGVHYHFVTKARFDEMVEADAFAEYAIVHGNGYGTATHVVDEAIAEGRSLLFDIDWQGAASLRARYPSAVSVMVFPPNLEALEARLRGRGEDSEEVVQRRLKAAKEEMAHAPSFDFIVVNDALDDAFDRLGGILRHGTMLSRVVYAEVAAKLGLPPAP
jgi:guanylate kinase